MKNKFTSIFACFIVIFVLIGKTSASETKEDYIKRVTYAFDTYDEQQQMLIDHLEDTKGNLKPGTRSFETIESAINRTRENNEIIKPLLKLYLSATHNSIEKFYELIDGFIQLLLEGRFRDINTRLDMIENTQKGDFSNCLPTYKSGTKKLTSEEQFMENVRIYPFHIILRTI